MSGAIIEEKLRTEIVDSCDVLVCGGGFAGISAALAAARQGKRVILAEKQFLLGGLGTAGLVTIYLPICDGRGRQICFGIAEELLRLSISEGHEGKYPANWLDSDDPAGRTADDPRFRVQYNPSLFAALAEKLLAESGVKILYGYAAAGVSLEGKKISAVIFENKSGRQAIAARSVVDATGDCDVARLSGTPTAVFGQGNVLAAWYYLLGDEGYRLNILGASDMPEKHKNEKKPKKPLINRRFSGLDAEELSEMVCLSHGAFLSDLRKKRKTDPTAVPTSIASIPQIRMTRRIAGEYVLDDAESHKYFPDSVGMIPDWRKRGPVYEVPFGSLYSKETPNLITAGRSISVSDAMWDISRVIPCCAVTGQAAGTAAALSDDFSSLDIAVLQKELETAGVVLHEKDLTVISGQ